MDDLKAENGVLRNLLTRTTRAYEEQLDALAREKDLADVTLASIGDGVVTTDEAGLVRYLNPVAETLTGWSRDEAWGRPLGEIFRLVSERTDRPIEISIERFGDDHPEVGHEPTGRTTGGTDSNGGSEQPFDSLLIRRDSRRFAVEHTAAPICSKGGEVVGLVIVFQDVTDQRLLSLQLTHQASHDSLTGLLNRSAFGEQLTLALEESQRRGFEHAFCFLDLDQFKVVNDTCGHLAGNEALRQVASILRETVRETDRVARLGGDEFGILLTQCPIQAATRIAENVQARIREYRFRWEDKLLALGVSIGVVSIDQSSPDLTRLLSAADQACYSAKQRGRNRIQVYRSDAHELRQHHHEVRMVVDLQESLDAGRFRLFSQVIRPVVDDPEDGIRFEVLVRMVDDSERLRAPGEFLPAAERYGLMEQVDRWVVRETVRQLSEWSPIDLARLECCAINLSAASLDDETFLGFVRSTLAQGQVPGSKFCFEITETSAVANLGCARRLIEELSSLDCRFALDDFGSGMSSYGKLKGLPVHFLKIDQTFIEDLVSSPLDRAIVESINQMGHVMGIATIAEGVSSAATAGHLADIGIDFLQGEWIGPPELLDLGTLSGSASRQISPTS